ncbi:unnamed protein product [Sphenostylis stenocarpa]|uniref:Uncharacterized protein n=1 Tax=Sphenostylis stenocarpa TaxID=92480 RepID=A0AA86T5G4_9FABA|nr:unnamed protein product [Sphenostylis stenocarpa]
MKLLLSRNMPFNMERLTREGNALERKLPWRESEVSWEREFRFSGSVSVFESDEVGGVEIGTGDGVLELGEGEDGEDLIVGGDAGGEAEYYNLLLIKFALRDFNFNLVACDFNLYSSFFSQIFFVFVISTTHKEGYERKVTTIDGLIGLWESSTGIKLQKQRDRYQLS